MACFWASEGAWFEGVVEAFDATQAKQKKPRGGGTTGTPYRIRYDDGDFEDMGLPDDTVRYA